MHRICSRLNCSFTFKQYSHHAINAGSRAITSFSDQKPKEKNQNAEMPLWKADTDILATIPEDFNYKDLVCCVRQSFKSKGYLEELSENFIEAAIEGDVLTIAEILRKGDIHPDVTDSTGFSAMLAAAVSKSVYHLRNSHAMMVRRSLLGVCSILFHREEGT